jgi:hypothetical protein
MNRMRSRRCLAAYMCCSLSRDQSRAKPAVSTTRNKLLKLASRPPDLTTRTMRRWCAALVPRLSDAAVRQLWSPAGAPKEVSAIIQTRGTSAMGVASPHHPAQPAISSALPAAPPCSAWRCPRRSSPTCPGASRRCSGPRRIWWPRWSASSLVGSLAPSSPGRWRRRWPAPQPPPAAPPPCRVGPQRRRAQGEGAAAYGRAEAAVPQPGQGRRQRLQAAGRAGRR